MFIDPASKNVLPRPVGAKSAGSTFRSYRSEESTGGSFGATNISLLQSEELVVKFLSHKHSRFGLSDKTKVCRTQAGAKTQGWARYV
jgi:hypothetical protein